MPTLIEIAHEDLSWTVHYRDGSVLDEQTQCERDDEGRAHVWACVDRERVAALLLTRPEDDHRRVGYIAFDEGEKPVFARRRENTVNFAERTQTKRTIGTIFGREYPDGSRDLFMVKPGELVPETVEG